MDNSYTDPNNKTNLNGSAQSENNIPSKIPTGSSLSYIIKSMGGTKAVSALFGMLLLAGGVGAGIVLVTQPQLLEQKAATTGYILKCDPATEACPDGYTCDLRSMNCVNYNTDENYCGMAGKVCTSSQTCIFGECVSTHCSTADPGYECNACDGSLFCQPDTSITCGEWRAANCPLPRCGDGICNENAASCGPDCGTGIIDCGGLQCAAEDCHCTGGNLCTSLVCDPATHQSCIDQNREWCANVMPGQGMTCCEPGWVCNPDGEGCVQLSGPTSGPGTGTNAPVPTKSPSPVPVRTPSPTPSATPSPTPTATPTRSPSPTPSATPIVAQCVSTNIYTPAWTPVTIADFYNLPAGAQVYFCTQGTTNGLTFDKARFTINGVLRPEVTLQRPGGTDFCDLYTIPANTYSFTVQGEIHHTTLGWL